MAENWLWWRDGVIYQIYPRSFMDSNNDGIGDLPGITSKLDYLADLGVAGLWLSPIYPSPDVDFGYDVADYCDIDPKYGTMADFEDLVNEARKRQIHIILDLVMNHTSNQHPWFEAARTSRDDPHHDWYIWKDPKPGHKPPNNWASIFGGGGWEYVPELGQFYFHMFYKEQPDLNWRNPAVRKEMLDVYRFWLGKGVDGFRLDVFNAYFKDENFRDNPPALGIRAFERMRHIHDTNQPEMIPLLKEIRSLLDEKPGRYAVGETFIGDEKITAMYCAPGLLHQAFNFRFTSCSWNPARFLSAIQSWESALEPGSWPNYVLSNHDTPRPATRYGRGEDDERLKVAAALLLTQRGTPFMYYGDEIGMRDIPLSHEEIMDPIGKRYWPIFKGRDGCRSPMQWNASSHAGFSEKEPWLKVHENYPQRNVSIQKTDPNSLFHFFRRLIHLRRENVALREGMFQPLIYEPRYLLAYLRRTDQQTILVAMNFGRRRRRFVLGRSLAGAQWELLLSNKRDHLVFSQGDMLPLEGEEVCIIRMLS